MDANPREQALILRERVIDNPAGRAALERLRDLSRAGATAAHWSAAPVEFTKGSPIAKRAQRRHGWRALLGRGLPRLNEFDNLLWLRNAGFLAAQPLAALTTWESHRPVWQGLVTVKLDNAQDAGPVLLEAKNEALDDNRRELALVLGRTLGQLHNAGFVHRDFYLRNLLFERTAGKTRLGMIDCWRGGPGQAGSLGARLLGRASAYDIGCLFVHLPGLISVQQEELLLESYRHVRDLSKVVAGRLFQSAARARAKLAPKEVRRKRISTGPIQPTWSPSFWAGD
ncbi:MAG: hypothetical protein ACI8QS_002630 [Planctomycetota bacterium]|jgi:hypothetical protein